MRNSLLMNYAEPNPGEVSEENIAEAQRAFGVYARWGSAMFSSATSPGFGSA